MTGHQEPKTSRDEGEEKRRKGILEGRRRRRTGQPRDERTGAAHVWKVRKNSTKRDLNSPPPSTSPNSDNYVASSVSLPHARTRPPSLVPYPGFVSSPPFLPPGGPTPSHTKTEPTKTINRIRRRFSSSGWGSPRTRRPSLGGGSSSSRKHALDGNAGCEVPEER